MENMMLPLCEITNQLNYYGEMINQDGNPELESKLTECACAHYSFIIGQLSLKELNESFKDLVRAIEADVMAADFAQQN